MKYLIAFLVTIVTIQLRAATITFAITNSDGTPAFGLLRVYPVSDVTSVGTWSIKGILTRLIITNGCASVRLLQGNYYATNDNYFKLFAVPTGNGTYPVEYLQISGGNTYNYTAPGGVTLLSGGSNINVSLVTSNQWRIDAFGLATTQQLASALAAIPTNSGSSFTGSTTNL